MGFEPDYRTYEDGLYDGLQKEKKMATTIDNLMHKSKNDFGFTTHSEDEITEVSRQVIQETQTDSVKRLKAIEDLIMPLLINLRDSGDKEYIRWPNRKEILDKKIKDFLALTKL
jgi:hypothetical protein